MSASNSFLSISAANHSPEIDTSTGLALGVRSEEEALMERVQCGDQAALGILVERYASAVLGIGRRVLRDSGEAQDLVQDVFMLVHQKNHTYNPSRGSVRAWLMQTAYHRAFDRREYLQHRGFYNVCALDELAGMMQGPSNIEYEAVLRQSGLTLRHAFEELNEGQRQTLTLFFFEGYTLREIADRIQQPLANVRHHYYRGLKKLKESIDINVLKRDLE